MTRVKREPLLVDKWLADSETIGTRKFTETTKDSLRLAKRFVLDDQATRYCAEVIREAPRIIADAQDFAIPPYHRTYIEFPFKTWFRGITGREPDGTSDDRVGYLFVGNTLRVLVSTDKGVNADRPLLYPLEYELWRPWSDDEQLAAMKLYDVNPVSMDIFFWGESALRYLPGEWVTNQTFDVDTEKACHASETGHVVHVLKNIKDRFGEKEFNEHAGEWDAAGLRSLRENHRFTMVLRDKDKGREPEFWKILCQGSSGELRNAIALLLFLNRTQKIRVEREEPMLTNRMYKRRLIPLLKHRVITLHVDPKPRLLKLVAGEGIRRRLHDVRGHFCHNRIARESHHEHEWIEAQEGHMSEMQWYCECGALRWWRHEHQRGAIQQGIVNAEYKVVQ